MGRSYTKFILAKLHIRKRSWGKFKRKAQPFRVEKAASHSRPLYSLQCGDFNNSTNLPIVRCFSIKCFKNVPCLIDTGASTSMIREEIFRRLPSNIQNKIQKCTNSLTSITGHQLSILGECHLKLHTDKEGIIVRMIIRRKLPFPCILGVDALRKYGIIWNPTSNEIKITSPTIKRNFNCTTLQDSDPSQKYELQLNNKVINRGRGNYSVYERGFSSSMPRSLS